jgi:DNA mismatch endonuclease, patch repair protein
LPKYEFKNVSPTRSKTMRAIKGKNTAIELMVRKALYSRGFRYRIHYKRAAGSPDVAFPGKRVAVFLDSDFWHGKDWQTKKTRIRSNREYWVRKIERNMTRGREVDDALRADGWRVLRFWESDIGEDLDLVMKHIVAVLGNLENT